MSRTKSADTGSDEKNESVDDELENGADTLDHAHGHSPEAHEPAVGADDQAVVADAARAGETEQTGSWGTGTPGSSNVAGLQDIAPIESQVTEQGTQDDEDEKGGIDG